MTRNYQMEGGMGGHRHCQKTEFLLALSLKTGHHIHCKNPVKKGLKIRALNIAHNT